MYVVACQVPSGMAAMAERISRSAVLLRGLAGCLHRLGPVAFVQRDEALRPDPRGGDLGLHVAHHEIGGPDVAAQQVPDRLDLACGLVHLDGLELEPLGVGVDGVDDAAAPGGERADVEVVRGGDREADEPAVVERGHDEGDIGAMARPGVGVVVHDDVAGADLVAALGHLAEHALHVPRNGAGLQGRGLGRLREPLSGRVHEPRAEVLGLPDDRRVRHPHELVAHLRGDVLERALDDARGDGVHPAIRAAGEAVETIAGAGVCGTHGGSATGGMTRCGAVPRSRAPPSASVTAVPGATRTAGLVLGLSFMVILRW